MKKLLWALACIVAGAGVAAGFAALFWRSVYTRLPHLAEMKAACAPGGLAAAPAYVTAAKCQAYFADVKVIVGSAFLRSVITGLLAAFILLVLRFRVRPLPVDRPGGEA